ncbi:MAG TPA: hypothetical protein VF035_08470 [Longimicrobiales bacterium]
MTVNAGILIDDKTKRRVRTSAAGGHTGPLAGMVTPAYIVSGLFFFTPLIDIVTNVWPLTPGVVSWRYGAAGASANYLISVVFGMFLACCTAALAGHGRTLRVLAVTSCVTALAILLVAGEFALDVAQIKDLVPPTELDMFTIGAAKAELKFIASAAGFIVLGVCAWRAAKRVGAAHT